MAGGMTMEDDGEVLRVRLRGERPANEFDMALEGQCRWQAIFDECVARRLSSLIVVSEMTGWVSSAAVRATVTYAAHIIPRSIERIAFVDLNEETWRFNAFAEPIGGEHGIPLRVFSEEAAALRWLASGRSSA